MKKILYVILHGEVYKERYHNIKDTWGKDKDLLFYGDYEDIDKGIIKVSENKSYRSNEEKHINVLKYFNENTNYNYEWFFFCDDDTFVNVNKLEELLHSFNINQIHGQILRTSEVNGVKITPPILEYHSGGAGYLIHNSLLKIISKEIKFLNTGYSDVTLGICLRDLNIPISNSDLFKGQPPNFYGYSNESIINHITFHYIKTKNMMIELLNNIKKNDKINK
jgi:hypothetical protein